LFDRIVPLADEPSTDRLVFSLPQRTCSEIKSRVIRRWYAQIEKPFATIILMLDEGGSFSYNGTSSRRRTAAIFVPLSPNRQIALGLYRQLLKARRIYLKEGPIDELASRDAPPRKRAKQRLHVVGDTALVKSAGSIRPHRK
jgi:hypothetical protein